MSTVQTVRVGPVVTIALNRPDVRNAVDRDTAQHLFEAFERFEADDTARVAVLTGNGGHFCAGADLKAIADGRGNRVESHGPGPMGPTRMRLSKPVIAAIAGYAVAGGLELALWCDLRVAEEDAVLGVFCRRWGVPLIDGGTVRLPRLIGLGHAMDLILTGRPVSAEEALKMGLVNRVTPPGDALAVAEALAHELAQFPQECMAADRRSAYDQGGKALDEALMHELACAAPVLGPTLVAGAARFRDGAGRHGQFGD